MIWQKIYLAFHHLVTIRATNQPSTKFKINHSMIIDFSDEVFNLCKLFNIVVYGFLFKDM